LNDCVLSTAGFFSSHWWFHITKLDKKSLAQIFQCDSRSSIHESVLGSEAALVWTAFVPSSSEPELRRNVGEDDISLARSWTDLDNLIHERPSTRLIVDPTADGKPNIRAVLDLTRKFPASPLVVCVALNPGGFEAGAELSRYGVRAVVLDRRVSLAELADRWVATSLAGSVLGWAERSLAMLPFRLRLTLIDLFERPRRYTTAADLGLGADLPLCAVYRSIDHARLGTPKKLVVVAKMLRAYHHFRNSDLLVAQVSTLVGFPRVRAFVDHATHIFGCRPSNLRAEPDSQEIVRALLDWLYKPFS
jgi:AraC-like DNA-binding protein